VVFGGWLVCGFLMGFSAINTPRQALAEPIAFGFRGTVTDVFDGLGALPAGVTPGRSFFGAYVFDSETPNTGEVMGEGQEGIYHHEHPPAGVALKVGPTVFRSTWRRLDFDIVVTNDFGFAGTDGYGFLSRNNVARGVLHHYFDRLQSQWFAQTFDNSLFDNVDLPLTPPDLDVLGGGTLTVEGECTPCAGPAAFFRISGSLESLFTLPRSVHKSSDVSTVGDAPSITWDAILNSVPEPSAVGLTVAWLLAMGAWQRKARPAA
jgi:hypothetical protein